ncbi:MAG: hypothetical protein VXZ59_07160 [Cyanobacteriota bacterium]|nr:hypothetical protein [Cyanobacteriota bacterium]
MTRQTVAGKSKSKGKGARRWRKRWLVLLSPVLLVGGLIALAPNTPDTSSRLEGAGPELNRRGDGQAFHYIPDEEVYALDLDPRRVRFGLLEGWDREQDAFEDIAALAYVSGPMYERHVDNSGREITVPLGDLKFGPRVWRGRNRTASRQRAFIGIRRNGSVDFGYGELTDERARTYNTFIGGLHSLYNDLEEPPESYKGAYSISMGQRIRYYLPRIRMVMGLREDGHLEVLMSRDGLTLEQTKDLARRRGYVAAYMPDHASKSRFIIPGVKGFTEEDANWISGGATSFVHVPYLLRLSPRNTPLSGDLIADLTPKLMGKESCSGPFDCMQAFGNHLADRALAGLNRVMEQGVEPLARMIWAPTSPSTSRPEASTDQNPDSDRAPLREPPITADPLVLREQPRPIEAAPNRLDDSLIPVDPEPFIPLPPDLPPPVLLDDSVLDAPSLIEPKPGMSDQPDQADLFDGAPPPPELPPLPSPPPLPRVELD